MAEERWQEHRLHPAHGDAGHDERHHRLQKPGLGLTGVQCTYVTILGVLCHQQVTKTAFLMPINQFYNLLMQ